MWRDHTAEEWANRHGPAEVSLHHVQLLQHVRYPNHDSYAAQGACCRYAAGTSFTARDCTRLEYESPYGRACVEKKQLISPIGTTITPLAERPILEFDEIWSFVGHKGNVVWIWIVLERQTRRIVGLAFGDRSQATCRKLWASLPADYRKRGICYADFWQAYAAVLPSKRHRPVGKETGQTAHIERFNNTLRQRCANLVRKTRSFSKDRFWHEMRIRRFIDHYNQTKSV